MIIIIDYKAGNLTSVKRGLDHLGIESRISGDPAEIINAERIIFPGVGNASTAMENMKERGMDDALRESFQKGIPILGICLGSQIILDRSEEGDTVCIGLIAGQSKRFVISDPSLKIPHMGWNSLEILQQHPLLSHLKNGDEMYFVHSYYPRPASEENIMAETEYGGSFPSAIGKDNLFAVQFHPEKSGRLGLKVLENFAKWNGAAC